MNDMACASISPLLDETLRTVVRRYRLPADPAVFFPRDDAGPSVALAQVVEQARKALDSGSVPEPALKRRFTAALAHMIQDAMRPQDGDPVFQAMVLRHQVPQVREYASLSAHGAQDRRQVWAAVNAIAHPAKLRRASANDDSTRLARLHTYATDASWSNLADAVGQLLSLPDVMVDASLEKGLRRIRDVPALRRLQRLEALASDLQVRQYQSLWAAHGPRSGSPGAAEQGAASRRRGARVEALATQTMGRLACRLNAEEGGKARYRVVTSMRVPPSLPARQEHAKSEWDVVLLRQPVRAHDEKVWDVCLLVEAKASVEATATDLPRLMRGLNLLAQAECDTTYIFQTRQGAVALRGASLRALNCDEGEPWRSMLYFSDASADDAPRLLGAASRMQLLSAQASLEFAAMLATEPSRPEPGLLAPVWGQLLEAPRWHAVLNQYPTLCRARELMVHAGDLLNAIS